MDRQRTIKIITASAICFLVILVAALVINIVKLSNMNKRKAELTEKISEIERRLDETQSQIDYVTTDEYIDQYAREYLDMKGEGETSFTGRK